MSSSSLSKYIALLIRRGVNDIEELVSILNVSEDDVKERFWRWRAKDLLNAIRKGFEDTGKWFALSQARGLNLLKKLRKSL